MLIVAGFVAFYFTMALTKFGDICLGKDDEPAEFSLTAWFSMLFAAGMGIGLVFWGVAEPMFHYSTPPFAEAKSPQAAADAMCIAFFHWGLCPWAGYAVVALVLAYFQFRKGKPGLLSWTLEPLIGKERVQSSLGKTIDALAVVVTFFGVANSLGLGALQVCTGLNKLYGIPNSTTVAIIIIIVVTVLYIFSAVTGVRVLDPDTCQTLKGLRKEISDTTVSFFWKHLSASLLYSLRHSLSVIQTIPRHKSPSTTERYLKSFGLENTREAFENLSHNSKQSFSSEPEYGKVMFGGKQKNRPRSRQLFEWLIAKTYNLLNLFGDPKGNRTPASGVRGQRPNR